VPTLRLFAQARHAAGVSAADIAGATVQEVLDVACTTFGPEFAELLDTCVVWVNGEPAERSQPVDTVDEVAVLPPVSGGDR
jgi:molybdopterin converting factor small subunit